MGRQVDGNQGEEEGGETGLVCKMNEKKVNWIK